MGRSSAPAPDSYMAAYSFALTLTRGIRLESDIVLCSFLPIVYHVADQIFTLPAFLSGGRLVIGRRPVPAQIAEAVTGEAVTALWAGSPAMANAFAGVLDAEGAAYDARTLKVLVYGWAALPPATTATLKRLCGDDLVPVEIFGQTEAISCHRFWPPAPRRRQGGRGRAAPSTVGRGGHRHGRTRDGRDGDPGRADRVLPRAPGRVRDAEASGLRHRAARDGGWQSAEVPAAGGLRRPVRMIGGGHATGVRACASAHSSS